MSWTCVNVTHGLVSCGTSHTHAPLHSVLTLSRLLSPSAARGAPDTVMGGEVLAPPWFPLLAYTSCRNSTMQHAMSAAQFICLLVAFFRRS
jgi:hypothetical protein